MGLDRWGGLGRESRRLADAGAYAHAWQRPTWAGLACVCRRGRPGRGPPTGGEGVGTGPRTAATPEQELPSTPRGGAAEQWRRAVLL